MTDPLSHPGTALCRRVSLCDGPRLATRQVNGLHRILAIRAVDTACAGLVARGLGRRRQDVRRRHQGGPLTVDRARPRLIGRGDLLAALDRAVAGKVTIISAPAGSGKTSLLRAWAGRPGQPRRLAVMQVQRDQRDAQQFWLALLSAVRQASAPAGRAEPPAATPGFNGRAMVDRVLSELAGQQGQLILVLDDLHELICPDALAQLTRLLTSLPGEVHAVLATRRDLPLRLQQLRLAAISLAGHPDPERFVAEFSGSDRTVAEYLVAEMLERQPDDVKDLLLRTSLLDSVNGELADLLTGRPGSERILLELENANAFVVSLDPGRTWFRYHHLFADLLRLQLRRALPEEVPVL